MNVEMDQGAREEQLYNVFYGDDENDDGDSWRDRAIFASFVLTPLEWSGLIQKQQAERGGKNEWHYLKTPLWRSVLELDLDEDLAPIRHH